MIECVPLKIRMLKVPNPSAVPQRNLMPLENGACFMLRLRCESRAGFLHPEAPLRAAGTSRPRLGPASSQILFTDARFDRGCH